MAALTGRISVYKQTGKTETLLDTRISSNSATSLVSQGIAFRVGLVSGNQERVIILDPMDNPGRVQNVTLPFNVVGAGTENMVFLPITAEVAKLAADNMSFQYVSISGTDDFDEAASVTSGAGTDPGHNTDNSVRAVVSMATGTGNIVISDVNNGTNKNPSSGSLDDVWNAARKAAMEQGAAYAGIIVVSENEGATTNFRTAGVTTIEFDLFPTPLDGWIFETVPQLRLPTTSTVQVISQFGTADLSGLSTATMHVESTGVEIVTKNLLTELGDPSDCDGDTISQTITWSEPLAGEPAPPVQGYKIVVTLNGTEFKTPQFYTPFLVGDNTLFRSGVTGDDHKHALLNHAAGKTVSGTTDGPEGLAAQQAAETWVATLCDQSSSHPKYWMFTGDNMDFAQFTSFQCFPIKKDGSGVADDAADTIIAKNEADAYEVVRSYMVQSYFPWELVPSLLCIGNHAPYHWHGFSANNSSVSNVSQWILNSLITFKLIPEDGDVAGYDQPTSNKGLGHFAFKCGNTQTVVLNVGHASEHTGDISAFTGGTLNSYPVSLGDETDWKLNSTVLSWVGGVYTASTATMLDQFQHNPMGNRSVGGLLPLYYDRADWKTWDGGYFGANILPLIVARFGGRWFLNLGHDHNEDYVYHTSGGCVTWHATPGNNSTEGPYNPGFVYILASEASGLPLHSTSLGHLSNRKDNAGMYIRSHFLDRIRRDFVFTGVSTDDAGTEYLLTAANYVDGYRFGDIIRTLEVPKLTSGTSNRPVGRRATGKRPTANRPTANRGDSF